MESAVKKIDILIGTDATKSEKLLGWMAGIAGASLYLYFALNHTFNWSIWQYLLASFIAFDVVGGAVANSLNSCKQFYRSSPRANEPIYLRLVKNKLFFAAIHIHPLVIGSCFGSIDLLSGLFWYVALLVSVLITMKAPLYLSRPIAISFVAIAIILNYYAIEPIVGFEWFIPLLFLKIVLGHTVKEEPYRSTNK